MAFVKAIRKSVPLLISVSGTSGSGKTYSALLIAGGLADGGKVGFLDTENGRGSMYADDPGIVAALPQGYVIDELSQPFSPTAYIEKIKAAEKEGVKVLVIDSMTHEWEGYGGCADIAENNKLRGMPNWAKAKIEHKRLVNYLLSTKMHIVFCLRAREKTKIVKDASGKEQFVSQGVQPIQEKNFVYEMLLSLQLDETTHAAFPVKVPAMLKGMFPVGGKLVTRNDGEAIANWNASGRPVDDLESMLKRARLAAEGGMASYETFFKGLGPQQQRQLKAMEEHDEYKNLAGAADQMAKEAEEAANSNAA